ncbi:hypothetical protein ACFDAU_09020 [Sulfuriferula sp. GW1]|uniref:hypothetical protein n=1 Tax=Sulfuriferula sp. GW1 TaxID=3345111 RepID=UPI0039B09699
MSAKPQENSPSDQAGGLVFAWEIPPPRARYWEIHISRNTLIAVIASLLLHAILLFALKQEHVRIESPSDKNMQGPLVVQLSPRESTKIVPGHSNPEPVPPTKKPIVRPRPQPRQHISKPKPHARVSPRHETVPTPVMTAPKSALDTHAVPPVPDTTAPSTAPPTDMASYINAVRARREAAEQANAESGTSHTPTPDEIRSANIERNLRPAGGANGVFQILSMGVRTAQFSFRGWTTDSSNFQKQVINVDAGLNGDIERAIVRRMIEVIRQYYQGDFNWESQRLNRVVVLSARKKDTAGLEDFLMKEFFKADGEQR